MIRLRPPCVSLLALVLTACQVPPSPSALAIDHETLRPAAGRGPRILCVVAHPDDEIAFSGTLYKTATHLDGQCDLAVITNGEGGYKYSTLAEPLYGLDLTDPEVGRAELPAIRRRELVAGCSLLGVHRLFFLGQKDHRNTLDPAEVLAPDAGVWDLAFVRASLAEILREGSYDFVLTHLPNPETHGHHKAATILALEAVAALPLADRPVVLGAGPSGRGDTERAPFTVLQGYPITAVRTDVGPFVFDRTQKFGYRDRLDYQIVVNWAIAEHKSQGTFQSLMNRWDKETFTIYALDAGDAPARTAQLFEALATKQFSARDYDEAGATRTSGSR